MERITQSGIRQIDLLLAIDNSRSMADKQEVLALAVPDLVAGLLSPPCVDPDTLEATGIVQPASPLDECPAGSARRARVPIADLVAHCPAKGARRLRLVGDAKVAVDSTLYITCTGD